MTARFFEVCPRVESLKPDRQANINVSPSNRISYSFFQSKSTLSRITVRVGCNNMMVIYTLCHIKRMSLYFLHSRCPIMPDFETSSVPRSTWGWPATGSSSAATTRQRTTEISSGWNDGWMVCVRKFFGRLRDSGLTDCQCGKWQIMAQSMMNSHRRGSMKSVFGVFVYFPVKLYWLID